MKRIALFVIGVALLSAQTLSAHHSFDAEFDRNKPVTAEGFGDQGGLGKPAHLGLHRREGRHR